MSITKYEPSILAGIHQGGSSLFRWPADLPRLGRRTVVPFTRCADCPKGIHPSVAGTFVRYGTRALCLRCARARAEAA